MCSRTSLDGSGRTHALDRTLGGKFGLVDHRFRVAIGLANGHLDTWRHKIHSWERSDPIFMVRSLHDKVRLVSPWGSINRLWLDLAHSLGHFDHPYILVN